jgi:hypothetical protein
MTNPVETSIVFLGHFLQARDIMLDFVMGNSLNYYANVTLGI